MSQAPATNVAGTALGSGFGTAARKPLAGPESAVADIFLSPRVVDKRTFEEYSATLQQLIREASGHGRTLETTSTEIKSLREGVQTISRDLQTRLEAALKVLPSLESRVSRAEQVAQDVTKLTADPEALAEQIRQILTGLVSAKADEVEALCRQTVERSIARIEGRERDITRAGEEFEAFVGARLGDLQAAHEATLRKIEEREKAAADSLATLHGELIERLSKAESAVMQQIEARERAALDAVVDHQRTVIQLQATIEGKLDEARRAAEAIGDENRRALETQQREASKQIEEAERAMRVKLDELREQASEIERRSEQRQADAAAREGAILDRERQIQQKLDDMVNGMEQRLAPLHEQVDRDVRELDKRIRRARVEVEVASGPGMQRLEQLCRAAASLLGPQDSVKLGLPPGEATGFPGLAPMVEHASRVHDRMVAKAGEFATLEQQVEVARRGIDKAILEGADKIDLLLQQTEGLERAVATSRAAAKEIERTVEGRIDQLRADAQAFHEYTSRLGEHLMRLNENAEKLAAELGVRFGPDAKPAALAEPLLQQSIAAAETLRDLLDKAGATIRALDHVATQSDKRAKK
ncbi:MAG: hypothetical protein K2Y21_00825 [Phycisphaerales bacterium]|nr:hypothetical protein [Phycisphaerales bacterium]